MLPVLPSGFAIGPLYVRYYGIILMLGALAGAWLASREARRRGLNGDLVWDALIWVLIGGIVGARIWHILTPPPSMVEVGLTTGYYLTHPLDALAIWKGGLGIPGAVIGGVLALYLFCRRSGLRFVTWLDIGAPALALGQAIGRWGNYPNQELYGGPFNAPWAVYIQPEFRLPQYANVAYYHPTFLYESLWSLMNLGVLLVLSHRYSKKLRPGDLFLIYLVIYAIGRFGLEFLRLDSSQLGGINANQTLMAVVGLGAAALLIGRRLISKDAATAEEGEEAIDETDPIPAGEKPSGIELEIGQDGSLIGAADPLEDLPEPGQDEDV
jgi:phosphatidylglycerol:prolipoprotein diacylglycerol transferase